MSSTARRPHDAQASRHALLDAAAQLFQERGYDGTTIREIGERAGVDPALIARYFDGKEGLYLAALADERYTPPLHTVGSGDLVEFIRMLFDYWDARGPSPVVRALVSPATTAEAGEHVRAIFDKAIGPLSQRLSEEGLAHPQRRAELLMAAMCGIQMVRQNGVLPGIAEPSTEELLELLEPMARALQQPDPPA
jgi:AcrR family transcriptional regulator